MRQRDIKTYHKGIMVKEAYLNKFRLQAIYQVSQAEKAGLENLLASREEMKEVLKSRQL